MIWQSTTDAAKALNKHPETLRRRIHSHEFIYGIHYRKITSATASRPEYEFNVDAINTLWATPPEKRKPAKIR
jgi:IS30 family transposase